MARKSTLTQSKSAGPPPADMSFEEAIAELEAIINQIEQGQVGLEESLAAYRRGAALLKRCREILENAEQQVQQLTAPDSGKSTTRPEKPGRVE